VDQAEVHHFRFHQIQKQEQREILHQQVLLKEIMEEMVQETHLVTGAAAEVAEELVLLERPFHTQVNLDQIQDQPHQEVMDHLYHQVSLLTV
jgi:hypothetical protein